MRSDVLRRHHAYSASIAIALPLSETASTPTAFSTSVSETRIEQILDYGPQFCMHMFGWWWWGCRLCNLAPAETLRDTT